jgi:hypothetical protein
VRIKIGDKHLTKLKDVSQRKNTIKKTIVQDPDLPRNRVDVKALKSRHGEDFLEIMVFSTHGTGHLAAKAVIRPSQYRTAKELIYAIEVAGAAGAEHLAEAYGDELDPDVCASHARELGIEALKQINKAYKSPGHHDNKIIITPG